MATMTTTVHDGVWRIEACVDCTRPLAYRDWEQPMEPCCPPCITHRRNREAAEEEAEQYLRYVVDDASAVFWRTVAAAYPEAKSGDLAATVTHDFDRVALAVVREWKHWNVAPLQP